MKKSLLNFLLLTVLFITSCNQTNMADQGEYIEWFGANETANEFVMKGISHYLNYEQAIAYTYFKGSLEVDPSLFAPHVVLAWMSPKGDVKTMHINKARELVNGKNENSRLLVSMFDIPSGEGLRARRHTVWSKMHEIEPDGNFIHYYYAITKDTPEERIAELEVIVEKLKSENKSYSYALNNLAYLHYNIGNKDVAKQYFEDFVKSYPTGYNAQDSMGEYYFMEKDYDNALIHYKKSLELFPGSTSGYNKIKEINTLLGK
jgi:tetratricopeptide (TPR) repeat protein